MLTYPATPLPSYSLQTGSSFKTLVSDFDSGAETRRKLIRFPKRNYSMTYNYLVIADRNTLQNFYRNVGGMSDSFWFVDFESRGWIDEYVGRGGPLDLFSALYDDGGTITNQTIACVAGTANAMTLLPAVPVVNDAYYFGSNSQFDLLTLTIGMAGAPAYNPGVAGWVITWEYWNGTTWHAYAGGEVTDDTVAFTAAPGAHDVHLTVPTDWVITSVSSINAYWVRARVSTFETITTRPLGSGCTSNSHTYELHGVTCSSYTIYIDGVAKTGGGADYTFVSEGGGAGADRITFTAYPSVGTLITSDFTGYLRLKARLGDDSFKEDVKYKGLHTVGLAVNEVQW